MCIARNPKRNNINIFHFSFGVMQVRVLRLKNKGKKCPQQQCPAVASYLLQNVNKKIESRSFEPPKIQKQPPKDTN